MYIDGLAVSSSVGLEILETKKNKKLFFETEILSVEENLSEDAILDYKRKYGEHFCLFQEIMYKNKALVLKSKGYNVSITTMVEDRTYKWSHCRLVRIPQGYLCVNHQDVQPFNRRLNYRLELLVDGVVKMEDAYPKLVMIKDVSNTGISFIVDNDFKIELGDMFQVTFQDEEYSKVKQDYIYTLYKLDAVVVRKLNADESDRVVVGCKVLSGFRLLESYIARKQQQRLQLNRTTEAT